ncbi:MAG: hypothetical protein AMXMBFR53_36530 [Gemmatimonadota bacterium]
MLPGSPGWAQRGGMTRLPLIAYAAILTACSPGLVDPIRPEAMAPGLAQERAAEHVSACSGANVTARAVRWWLVAGIEGDGDAWAGWNPPGDVYLLRGTEANVRISAHELLHHVLGGDPGHRDGLWLSCGLDLATLREALAGTPQ